VSLALFYGGQLAYLRGDSRKKGWGIGSKLEKILDKVANIGLEYSYDNFGNPKIEKASGKIKSETVRYLNDTGQVYETPSGIDRKYAKGGQLLVSKNRKYTYNECGDLIEKREADGRLWKYEYNIAGLMTKVVRPDRKEVTFTYDPLARRVSKNFEGKTTKYIWDGNKIVHELVEDESVKETPITWLYEEDSFTPILKITEQQTYSIISDHLGTPLKMVDESGGVVWNETFDLWGKEHLEVKTQVKAGYRITKPVVRKAKESEELPFRYQGLGIKDSIMT
jgi:YD repeat-containing protein